MIRARLVATRALPARARLVRTTSSAHSVSFCSWLSRLFRLHCRLSAQGRHDGSHSVARADTGDAVLRRSCAWPLCGCGGMRAGLSMMTLGVVLTIAIIALGG